MGQSETFSYPNAIHAASVLLDRYYTPLVCILGCIGNSLSLLVFVLDSKYRSQSASYYLSALALSDTGFLINLFAVWLESVKELVITSDFTCPLVMYSGQVTCFLSIYLIVAFSVERYVAVHYPLARAQICTRSKARKIIAVLTIVALLLFSYAWVIAEVVELRFVEYSDDDHEFVNGSATSNGTFSVYRCSVPQEYYRVSEIANYLDTCITLVLPFLLISFFNARIASSLWKLKESRRELMAVVVKPSASPTATSISGNNGSEEATTTGSSLLMCLRNSFWRKSQQGCRYSCSNTVTENVEMTEMTDMPTAIIRPEIMAEQHSPEICPQEEHDDYCSQSLSRTCNNPSGQSSYHHHRPHQHFSTGSSSEMKVTKTLLLVSSVFLLLNLPLHGIRCAQFIQTLTAASGEIPSTGSERQQQAALDNELYLQTAQLWANMLFNTNFAVNFLLYCANGRNFRNSLRRILLNRILRRKERHQLTSAASCHNNRNARGSGVTPQGEE